MGKGLLGYRQGETAPKNAGTCIGLRRYLHEATQVSALKPHSFMLAFSGGQGTGLRPDWVARKFNHRSALFQVQNQVTIPEKSGSIYRTHLYTFRP